jgi:RNA polymerase II subunit A-like phosphatase
MRIYLTFLVLVDEFFVGIGDINSAFLPKITSLTPSIPSQLPSSSSNPATPPSPSASPDPFTPTPSSVSEMSSETAIHETSPTPVGSDDEELEKGTMLTRNSIALEAQVEERPLAKKQEELEEQEQKEEAQNQSDGDTSKPNGKGVESAEVKTHVAPQPVPHKHTAKALLRNDDYELLRVNAVRYFHLCLSIADTNERG